MEKAVPAFLQNTYLYQLPVKIVGAKDEPDGMLLQFSDTIFHPQGGGQPNDTGKIRLVDGRQLPILSCINDRETGKICYKVAKDELLQIGSEVTMVIDEAIRKLNARLHSAGHLLDVAVNRLKLDWKPGKGYHFADSPYVEYVGVCEDKEKTQKDLQKEVDELLATNPNNTVDALTKHLIDETFKGDRVRFVDIMGVGCPCGGTHVQKVGEVGALTIAKIAKKGKNLRVSYTLQK